jgi:AraC-like DNA-binding protein
MDQLNDARTPDPVSDVLRSVRIRSTVLCRSVLSGPWGFGIIAHGNPVFHVITVGSCWLEVDGEPGQMKLAAGDLVLLPTGRRHWLRDTPDAPARELEDVLTDHRLDERLRLRYGGNGAKTSMLCGWFALEGGTAPPMLGMLPGRLVISGSGGQPARSLSPTLALLSAEAESDDPGAVEVLARLADAMLAQALRSSVSDVLSWQGNGAAARDRSIAEALAQIHRRPEYPWTVEQLAAHVALSRSAFSERFRERVGESPKRYLTRTRLAHAGALLQSGDASLAEIAQRVGYASEFSFAKAFKRAFGVAPGAYRALGEPAAGANGRALARVGD